MENSDLLVFSSPQPSTSYNNSGVSSKNLTNDLLCRTEVDENLGGSPFQLTSPFATNRLSLGLNFNDIGKESLGILPDDFHRKSLLDLSFTGGSFMNLSTRDSMGFINLSSKDVGKESLGILNESLLGKESLAIQKENFDILNLTLGRESLAGRESLGILKLTEINCKTPEIFLTTSVDKNESFSDFNNAFVQETPRKGSVFSSISSTTSINPLFNSQSLEGPSKIFSLSTNKNFESTYMSNVTRNQTDVFNFGFCTSVVSVNSPDRSSGYRNRIQSLPVTLEEKLETANGLGPLKFQDEEDVFIDSVFIEANHIADKIADGSIYEETSGNGNILDSTPQPDWPEDFNDSEIEKPKCDTETVFKTVDKMLPNFTDTEIKLRLKLSKSDSVSSNDISENANKSSRLYNLSNISRISNGSGINASKLLKNLSDMIHENDSLSKSQKHEGHNLLQGLAGILCENNSRSRLSSSDDSGHSSTEEPKSDKKDALQPVIEEQEKHSEVYNSQCNIKTNIPDIVVKATNNSSLEVNKSNTSNFSTGSHNGSKGGASVAGKLRPTKATYSVGIKRGPLKATVPIGDMSKKLKPPVTPTRMEQTNSLNSKRTSTPIREPKLKPMAASTPAARPVKDKKECAVSPLARPRGSSFSVSKENGDKVKPSLRESLNNASSKPLNKSISRLESTLVRRNSISEIKNPLKESTVDNMKLRRCNSVGKETKIMSALSKVRQNILSSPYYQTKKNLADNNNTKNSPGIPKLSSLPVKLKKVGKENIEK